MKFTISKIQDVLVVELDGEMWGGYDSLQLKDTVQQFLDDGERRFVVDLSATKIVNSAGVGSLIACKEIVSAAGGTYLLCGVSERTRTVFAISEVTSHFTIVDSREDAMSMLGQNPGT